jgi:ribosomal-protein-alanine N-acetyltransferase
MSDFRIRPFEARDVAAVAALEAVCNPKPWSAAALSAYTERHSSKLGFVAEGNVGLIGYIIASRAADEAEILQLGVAPESRRAGIAAKLLRELFVRLRASGVRSVFLEVRHGNTAAIGLYRSLGFGEAGERKGYYQETGEDALLFSAFLK